MPANDTANRVRKIPSHRKVKYLLNDVEWSTLMADHYFNGATVSHDEALKFAAVVGSLDIILDEFLGVDWICRRTSP